MFSNLSHSFFQTEMDKEFEYKGKKVEGGGNKYKNNLKKEKYIDTLYDDDFVKNYFL